MKSEVKKPLSLSRGKLELRKTVDAGQVKQTFPHGRSKTVAVEVKRKRTYAPGAGGKMTEVPTDKDLALATAELSAEDRAHLSNLTAGERATRTESAGGGPSATTKSAACRKPKMPYAAPPKRPNWRRPRKRAARPPRPAARLIRRSRPAAANDVVAEVPPAKPKGEPAVKRIEPNVVRPSRGPAVAEIEDDEEPRARSSVPACARRQSRWRRAATSRAVAPARCRSTRLSTKTPASA